MKILKVTYLTEPQFGGDGMRNLGDRVIFEGVRNLMRLAIGGHEEAIRHLSDVNPLPDEADVIVVCGMPQISQGSSVGRKIKRIVEAAQSKIPVRLNVGAGSFYFDAFGKDREKKDADFAARVKAAPVAKAYAEYAGFDLCTCRDLGAVAALRMLGVEAMALPCPGFFSAIFQPRPLFRRPEQLVSVLNGTVSFWNRVDADVHGFYRRLRDADPTRIFLAHDENDCAMLSALDIPHVTFDSARQLLTYLATFERLLSLRVHGALPAWTLGLDVTLLGIDRRALIGEDFGAKFRVIPLRGESDLAMAEMPLKRDRPAQSDRVRRAWLRRYLDLYVRNIREVLSRKLGCEIPNDIPLHAASDVTPTQPSISRAPGNYFSNFFYSTERSFPIEPKRLRSAHSITYLEDGIRIETTAANNTLAYGPYILVPKGRWKATARVRVVEMPTTDEDGKHALTLRIMKGIPSIELAAQEVKIPSKPEDEDMRFEVEFENLNDTSSIETVFATRHRVPTGTRFHISVVEMKRLD